MNWKKIKAMVLAFFAFSADHNEPIDLTAEQKEKLDAAVKKEGFAEKFIAKFNEDLDSTTQLDAISEEVDAFMASNSSDDGNEDGTQTDAPKGIEANEDGSQKSLAGKVKAMGNQIKALQTEKQKLEANFNKLKKAAEPDNPEIIKGNVTTTMNHSDTHLFASNNSWDAFEGRPWNQQAAGLDGATATSWNAADISQLNTDIQDFFRKDPKKLHDLMIDALEIPKYWKLVSNVSDEYVHVTFTSGEITQGIKKKWMPKNHLRFKAQIGKVRDIQIDIEFDGHDLKKFEKSYLNYFFNESSTPVKMSYVLFTVKSILKKARKEDKICLGRGVYAPNIGDKPASFLNNFSGVIKLALEARGKLYNPFKLGKPTKENIYDYVKSFIEQVPYELRNMPGLVLYMSPTWVRAYNEGYRRLKGRDLDFDGNIYNVDGFSNIDLYSYDQLDGTDFFFLTTDDNIYVLTDKLGEDNVIKFVEKTRGLEGAGDYKLAAFIAVFGRDLVDTPENSFENQLFFSNDVDVLNDVYVPVEANAATPSLEYHNSLMIGENNTQATNITGFAKAKPGTKIYLRGNSDANISTVKNNAKISLIGGVDCALTKDTLLVLYVKADGKFQELERTTVTPIVEEAKVVLADNATTIDASTGTRFVTSANTAATALTGITNAVKGETYRIEGAGTTNATTIADAGVFELTAAMTLSDGKYIELYYNGDKFIELTRG